MNMCIEDEVVEVNKDTNRIWGYSSEWAGDIDCIDDYPVEKKPQDYDNVNL